MSRHRVPMLSASLHGYSDPAASPDPTVRRLVSTLATLEIAPPPSPEFEAELRAQLVAVTPRLVAEGLVEDESAPVEAAATPARVHRRPARWRRPVGFAVSGLAALAVLLGALVWRSQSSLPGDPLYGLKRDVETVQLALTSGNEAKARLELHFAQIRTEEVAKLIQRPSALGAGPAADAPISTATAALVRSTLAAADADVRGATQLLTQEAMRSGSSAPLQILSTWAEAQQSRLAEIADSLPPGPLRNSALYSASVVITAQQRAAQVSQLLRCKCMHTRGSDSYGPVPCATCTSAPATSTLTASPSAGSPASSASSPGADPASGAPAPQQPGPALPGSSTPPGGGGYVAPPTTALLPPSSLPDLPSTTSLPSLTPDPSTAPESSTSLDPSTSVVPSLPLPSTTLDPSLPVSSSVSTTVPVHTHPPHPPHPTHTPPNRGTTTP